MPELLELLNIDCEYSYVYFFNYFVLFFTNQIKFDRHTKHMYSSTNVNYNKLFKIILATLKNQEGRLVKIYLLFHSSSCLTKNSPDFSALNLLRIAI